MEKQNAAKMLARWTKQGWLRRVARGAYVPASLSSVESEHVLDDPWVLVPALYTPGYIAGRTAAEHWDLTEQIFNDILVKTAHPFREKRQRHHGVVFTLTHISEEKIFGTQVTWRGQTKVLVSDVHRTLVDMLDDPAIGGGIQHVTDCLREYLKRPDSDNERLIRYAERLGNGAVFKRLGFLVERLNSDSPLVQECLSRMTKGNAKLDPALESPRLVKRWRIWIPVQWSKQPDHD